MHTNAKSVTIPWFRVGYPEPDLKGTIEAVRLALKANA